MGLLDMFTSDDPQQQAYLALAAGLLGNKGNFGSVVGQSMLGAQETYQNARKAQQQSQLTKLQLEEIQRKEIENRKRRQAA